MPTSHPRHSVTETPPMREALDALRVRGERVRMGELVIRGARERLRELEAERDDEAQRAELRRQLVQQLHTGEGIDVDAAYEVREHGWIHR
jgi:Arc/MetJ-type ribon-helix-helix transcriptional regulator